MIDYEKERMVSEILNKLYGDPRLLTDKDKHDIEYALRSVNSVLREPYVETIYHDEYGRTHSYRTDPSSIYITPDFEDIRYDIKICRATKRTEGLK